MADRYWVGGTGNWDSVSTTNWSATSGGASGASAPTYADNVIFDSASNATAYTVTFFGGFTGAGSISGTVLTITSVFSGSLAVGSTILPTLGAVRLPTNPLYISGGNYITSFGTGTGGLGTYNVSIPQNIATQNLTAGPSCADISIAGPTSGALTFAGSNTVRLSIYGSMAVTATSSNLTWSAISEIMFCANTTGKTISTNGVTIGTGTTEPLTFDGTGGGWTLGSALAVGFSTNGMRVVSGSFSTANFALTSGSLQSPGNNTRSISLGSSAVTTNNTSGVNLDSTGLTFDAGTSTISLSTVSSTFAGGGLTFYNVTTTNTGVGTKTFSGANTFNNLSFANRAAGGEDFVIFSADQTVDGALSLGLGTVSLNIQPRRMFRSNVFGTQRTIALGASATVSAFAQIDFKDIAVTGVPTPISGTNIGSGGNCSGITFTTPKTVYNVVGGNWTNNVWATTPTGSVAVANFPIIHDNAVITDSAIASGGTVTAINNTVYGNVDFSSRTLPINFSLTLTPLFYGALLLSPAVTITGATIRTGTATATDYTISGTSSGAGVIISGVAAGTLTISGLASGPGVIISGVASGTLTISGTSEGVFFGPDMYYGVQSVLRAYINSQEISRIYVGDNLILVSVRV